MIKAYHFTDGMKLLDGTPLVEGKTYTIAGPLVICKRGLHWSRRPIDALKYAPGSMLSIVEIPDTADIIEQEDKGCSNIRIVKKVLDCEKLLHMWTCDVAEAALLIGDVTDQRPWDAIEWKRAWVCGIIVKQ